MQGALLLLFAVDILFLLSECAQAHSEDQRTLTLQLLVVLNVRVIPEESGCMQVMRRGHVVFELVLSTTASYIEPAVFDSAALATSVVEGSHMSTRCSDVYLTFKRRGAA